MFHGLHDLSIWQSTALKSFVSGSASQLAIPLMKELSKRSDVLPFHVPSHPMLLVVCSLTALIIDQFKTCEGLGLKCCKLKDLK